MSDKTQRTPQGAEIPIPQRGAFERMLDKIARKPKPPEGADSTPSRPEK